MQYYPNPSMPGQPSHCEVDPPAPVIGTPVQEAWAININNNNVPSPMVGAQLESWTTERCSCCEDCNSSCCGSGTLCCFLCTCIYRRNLRMRYNLPESPCCDCCVDNCCECCSLCQMYRELQNRGLNMSLGYHQNMESRGQVNMLPPQGPGYMIR